MMTKQEALAKIEELKKYVEDPVEEQKTVGIEIRSIFGSLLFQSTKTTLVEAIREANLSEANLREANLSEANLRGADLSGANLRGAEMQNVKFYGRGGSKRLKRSQLPDFLLLGFIIEE